MADEDYGRDEDDILDEAPKFVPVKPIERADTGTLSGAALKSKEFEILKGALPKDSLDDFLVMTEAEDRRAVALDFSFRFKKRISSHRNRFARDAYEVLIGRPSEDAVAAIKNTASTEMPSGSASILPAKPKLRLLSRSNSAGTRDTPRAVATPVAAASSSSSSDEDYGFGRMLSLSAAAPCVEAAAEDADAMSLVTWEESIDWHGAGSGSGSQDDDDGSEVATSKLSRVFNERAVSMEHALLLATKSQSSRDASINQQSGSAAPAPKPEPLTLRNHVLLSCQWLNDVQWTKRRLPKGSGGRSASHGQLTISRHVRLPDEAGLKKLLCVSLDEFYSLNLHPLKNQRARQSVDHSAYAKSLKGLSMNISRYTCLISHQVHPPFLCWNSGDGYEAGAAESFELLNERQGFKLLPPKLPSEEEDGAHALRELSDVHHFTCIKGPIAVIEHYQEPIFLSSVGMCMRMTAYSKSITDMPAPDERDPTVYTWRNSEEMRNAAFFADLPENLPCLKTIENNMCAAPVVFHRKPKKHRAFLLVYRDGRMFLREVPGIHLVGQQLPMTDVKEVNHQDGFKFQMNRMLLRMNEECPPHEWSGKPLPVDEVLNLCGQERPESDPENKGYQLYKSFMKAHFHSEVQENEFGEKDKSSIEWVWGKAGVDTAKILQPMQPETACLLRASYMGEAMLQFCHIDKMRHVEGLPKTIESVNQHASQRDKDLVKIVHEALKRAPWTLTKTYLDKLENGFLVFSGLGLYCGIVAERKFVTPLGGKNLGIHQTTERPQFLAKMLEAYRSTDVADNTNERKDDEMRNFLMRRNNLLLQTRQDTTIVGGGELPVESRVSVYANQRRLMDDIQAVQLGRPNPFDLHRRHVPPPSRSGRGGKAKMKSISTASRKGAKKDEWDSSDESSSSESFASVDGDWFSDMEEEVRDDVVEEEEGGWIDEQSPPPPPPTKISIKRPPVASPSPSIPTPQIKTEAAAAKKGGSVAASPQLAASPAGGVAGTLRGGLQAVLQLMTQNKDFKRDYQAFYQPISAQVFKEYPKVIKNPKCIEDVIASIKANRYDNCDSFLSDLMLISSNCETFSRSGHIPFNEVLVQMGWALIVKVAGCFFRHFPAALEQLDRRKWSVQQRALFKIYEIDYDRSDFILRVNTSNTAYYKVVKKPICLSEVQMHAASAGSSPDSVAEKVRLLCSNCKMFCSSAHGAGFGDELLPLVDAILDALAILEHGGPVRTSTPSAVSPAAPAVFRIKSGAVSTVIGRAPAQSLASDAPVSSNFTQSPATFASARTPLAAPADSQGSIGYYVEQLAEKFPGFVPELKLIMDETTYRLYKQKIKEPMSISNMRTKVRQGAYSSMQFLADVQAIGSNCVAFWSGRDHQLVADAHALMKQGAAFALELERQEEAKRVAAATAAVTPSSAQDEPPKKKMFISLKRSGSNGSDA